LKNPDKEIRPEDNTFREKTIFFSGFMWYIIVDFPDDLIEPCVMMFVSIVEEILN